MTPIDTTLDDDLRELRHASIAVHEAEIWDRAAELEGTTARLAAAESRLRSRITALELENAELRRLKP